MLNNYNYLKNIKIKKTNHLFSLKITILHHKLVQCNKIKNQKDQNLQQYLKIKQERKYKIEYMHLMSLALAHI